MSEGYKRLKEGDHLTQQLLCTNEESEDKRGMVTSPRSHSS